MIARLAVPTAEPYPWPYDGSVAGAALAVVVAGHDVGWAARSAADDGFDERLAALVAACVDIGALVVTIAHDGPTPGSAGTGERIPLALPTGTRVHAGGVDGFFASPLDAWLRDAARTHLIVCGYGLEGPVHSTLRSANDRGYECLLVTDAAAPLDPGLHEAAVCTVTMSGGIFGAVCNTAAVLQARAITSPTTTDPGVPS
jgi:nicotinamidase-related amidase